LFLLQVSQNAIIARLPSQLCLNEQKIDLKKEPDYFSTQSIANLKTAKIFELF